MIRIAEVGRHLRKFSGSTLSLKQGPRRAGCPGQCSVRFWMSPALPRENLHPLWWAVWCLSMFTVGISCCIFKHNILSWYWIPLKKFGLVFLTPLQLVFVLVFPVKIKVKKAETVPVSAVCIVTRFCAPFSSTPTLSVVFLLPFLHVCL